jgi:hypothetical protein
LQPWDVSLLCLTSAEFVAAACIRLGLPHAQLRGTVGVDHLGREVLRMKVGRK